MRSSGKIGNPLFGCTGGFATVAGLPKFAQPSAQPHVLGSLCKYRRDAASLS
jgi:hypothetical protein